MNLKHEKFPWDQTDSYSLRKRTAEKCESFQNRIMFKGVREVSKFYYITRLRDMGENSKIDFFQDFHFNPIGTNVFFDACIPGGGPFCHPPRKSSIHGKKVQIRVTYHIQACFMLLYEVYYLNLA